MAIGALPPTKCKGLYNPPRWRKPRKAGKLPDLVWGTNSAPVLSSIWSTPSEASRKICNEHLEPKSEAATSAIHPTQTPRNGIAQVAGPRHATDMRLSFEDDPTSGVRQLFFASLKIFSLRAAEETDMRSPFSPQLKRETGPIVAVFQDCLLSLSQCCVFWDTENRSAFTLFSYSKVHDREHAWIKFCLEERYHLLLLTPETCWMNWLQNGCNKYLVRGTIVLRIPAIRTVGASARSGPDLFSSQRFRGYILALERQTLTFERPGELWGCHCWPPNGIHSLPVLCVKHFCWHPAMRRWWVNLAAECVL